MISVALQPQESFYKIHSMNSFNMGIVVHDYNPSNSVCCNRMISLRPCLKIKLNKGCYGHSSVVEDPWFQFSILYTYARAHAHTHTYIHTHKHIENSYN